MSARQRSSLRIRLLRFAAALRYDFRSQGMRLSLRYLLALGAAATMLVLVAAGAAAVAKAAPSPSALPPTPVQAPRPAAAGQVATQAFTAATERQLLDK